MGCNASFIALIPKSQVLGVGVPQIRVVQATASIGCAVMQGENSLDWWKAHSFESVLGASPIYNMSLYKAPRGVLKSMEAIRSRNVRDGVERSQQSDLFEILEVVSLSSDQDSWICDLSEDGAFHVKEVCNILDELIIPSHLEPTRWVKSNLIHRGVVLDSAVRPLCQVDEENIDHILFQCNLAKIVFRKICCWWELIWQDMSSYSEWSSWFSNIRLPAKVKAMLEGVFYVAWWSIWVLRNRTIFDETPHRRSVLFDDIVSFSFTWCSNRCNRVVS
nr:RNA-directed DNA polymerase, eukaryota [Tanacetum cinerariifolium]